VEDANTIRPVLEYSKGKTPSSNRAIPSAPPLDSILARREDGGRGGGVRWRNCWRKQIGSWCSRIWYRGVVRGRLWRSWPWEPPRGSEGPLLPPIPYPRWGVRPEEQLVCLKGTFNYLAPFWRSLGPGSMEKPHLERALGHKTGVVWLLAMLHLHQRGNTVPIVWLHEAVPTLLVQHTLCLVAHSCLLW
jgi:hypothetical protein